MVPGTPRRRRVGDAARPAGRTPVVKGVATLAVGGLLLSASCTGAAQPGTEPSVALTGASTTPASSASARPTPTTPRRLTTQVALVTAELRNELVVVSLPGGRVVRRIPVAPDPKTVSAAPGGPVAVVSPGSGTVTMFGAGLRRLAVFRGFRSPQLATFTPDGEYLLVTDAAAGTLTSIELARMRVVGRVAVGAGAHHLAVSPNDRRAWVALGESATTIVLVDVADPRHMRVLRRLHPAVLAHDIAFDPDGRTVWVSSASQPYISVYGAASGRLLGTVPAGRAPQHVLFAAGRAYVTSGYGSSIEMVDPAARTVLKRVELPYGSFNLAAAGHWLVTTSVLHGEVTVLRAATLRRRAQRTVASVARSVAVLSR
jgi:DNA-binding beta-propeller fold protein YncE